MKESTSIRNIPMKQIRDNVNDMIDDLLKSLGPRLKLANQDPLKLPDRSVEFQLHLCGKTYPGVAELKNGVCKGLSSAKRHGEIGLDIREDNVQITSPLRIGPVSMTFESDVTMRDRIYHPIFIAKAQYIDVLIDMMYKVSSEKMEMTKYKVEEISQINVKVRNVLIFERWLFRPVASHMTQSEIKFLTQKIKSDFKDNIKYLVENSLNVKRLLPAAVFS